MSSGQLHIWSLKGKSIQAKCDLMELGDHSVDFFRPFSHLGEFHGLKQNLPISTDNNKIILHWEVSMFLTLLCTLALLFLRSPNHILVISEPGALLTANFQMHDKTRFMYFSNCSLMFYPTFSFRGPPRRASVAWINRWESSQISGRKADLHMLWKSASRAIKCLCDLSWGVAPSLL